MERQLAQVKVTLAPDWFPFELHDRLYVFDV